MCYTSHPRIEPIKPACTYRNQPQPAITVLGDGFYPSNSALVLAAIFENKPGEALGIAVKAIHTAPTSSDPQSTGCVLIQSGDDACRVLLVRIKRDHRVPVVPDKPPPGPNPQEAEVIL
jgi:hypothetical protein